MSDYLSEIKRVIFSRYGCDALWTGSHIVREMKDGTAVWEGPVESYFLFEHPRAKSCFAWASPREHPDGLDVTVVLGIAPVYSAEDAVKLAVATRVWRAEPPQ